MFMQHNKYNNRKPAKNGRQNGRQKAQIKSISSEGSSGIIASAGTLNFV